MTLEPNAFAAEISDKLAAANENYTMTAVDFGEYGASYEITKQGSERKLYITPTDNDLIDMALFDENGATIASGTMFAKAAMNITSEELAGIIEICL